MPRVSIKI